MNITLYTISAADERRGGVLALQIAAGCARRGVLPPHFQVTPVRDGGVGDQELPMYVLQVMALKGADTFPLTVVDGNPAKSGELPELDDINAWLDHGVAEPVALVTDAVSAIEFPGTSRAHISLDVADVDAALPFYMVLFGARPTKRRDDYIKFELTEPSLNLTLNQHATGHASSGHYGIQVKSSRAVKDAHQRLAAAGFAITEETETACCYAVQTKIWVVDPDGNRWEVFVVTEAESDYGCGPDCICYEELERSFISATAAAALTAPSR